jgi:4-amino-4-deoxy-L-arabinose transferase-like glycosyltransferase
MASKILDRAGKALTVFLDGLCDAQRWRSRLLIVVVAYGAAWTLYGVIAKSTQDINADMAEMAIWAREPALGYPKHPPLLAFVIKAWFAVFPLTDWAFILLAVTTAAAGIYLATLLCSVWLDDEKRAVAPFLLAAIPFYNFFALKFDQNSALIPLWALTLWAFMRMLQTRGAGWAALVGAAAAAAMMSKYWSAFLLAAMAVALLFDRRRNDVLRSPAPWIAAVVFLLAVLPHVVWLVVEHFPPMQYVAARRGTHSVGDFLSSFTEYSAGTLGYAAGALALGLLFRPQLTALPKIWFGGEQELRPAKILFWTPLALPIAVAAVTRTNLLSLWNEPALNLLPVMMLGSPLVTVSRTALTRLAAIVIGLTLLFVAVSPLVALVTLKTGVENDAAYARAAAVAAEEEWRATTKAPLRLVAGPFALASAAAFYMTDRPSTYADFSDYLSPWATPERIARDGMVIICPGDDSSCLGRIGKLTAGRPRGRQAEVHARRSLFGIGGAPKLFIVTTVPPQD